ncbi:hypothetical protein FTO21_29025 [Klebsiella pneumoniae]|nr:hypothetical protein FTO21_29025 [Klebsiella pneumoniae]
MGSCAAPSAKGDDKFITTDYLQQCPETYLPHWLALRSSFVKLDSDALISVTRSRSQQKATNLDVSLAKPN